MFDKERTIVKLPSEMKDKRIHTDTEIQEGLQEQNRWMKIAEVTKIRVQTLPPGNN